MALKPDRVEFLTDLSFFMNVTGERGRVVIHDTGGSGSAMDDSSAVVKFPTTNADVSGANPAGLLVNDVVDIDLTRQHINFDKDEVQKGGKVLILRQGTVVANNISGTPTVGAKAYYDALGHLTATRRVEGAANSTQVGRFLSIKDADGYAKVEINII